MTTTPVIAPAGKGNQLAYALYCSFVQPSQVTQDNADEQEWKAITMVLGRSTDDDLAAYLAQEAGDHPDLASARMRWCRTEIARLLRNQGPT